MLFALLLAATSSSSSFTITTTINYEERSKERVEVEVAITDRISEMMANRLKYDEVVADGGEVVAEVEEVEVDF